MNKTSTLFIPLLLAASSAWAQGDMAAADLSPLDYQVPGTKSFSLTIKNQGSGVSSYNVYWKLDNGAVNTVKKTAYDTKWNGAFGLVQDPAFQVTLPSAGTYKLKVWVKSIAPVDNNASNDTIVKNIHVFETLPKKNVVLEIFKHQACGPCYDAANYTDTFVSKNPAYGIAAIYTGASDVLLNKDGKTVNDNYSFAHPGPLFDRFKFPFRSGIVTSFYTSMQTGYGLTAYGEREQFYEPVQVYFQAVTLNETTRELKVTIGAKFFDDLNGDYRFNLYLTEDNIKAFQASAPDPNNYYHKHVLRAMLGGPWGKQGSLPSSIKTNDSKQCEFTYTIPQDYNINKMHVIAMMQTYNANDEQRRILNSDHKTLKQAVSVNDVATGIAINVMRIYPNPAKDRVTVSMENAPKLHYALRVLDMCGKVYKTLQAIGTTTIDLQSLPVGNYIIHADDGQVVYTQTVVKE